MHSSKHISLLTIPRFLTCIRNFESYVPTYNHGVDEPPKATLCKTKRQLTIYNAIVLNAKFLFLSSKLYMSCQQSNPGTLYVHYKQYIKINNIIDIYNFYSTPLKLD